MLSLLRVLGPTRLDLRHALRSFGRRPTVPLLVVGILALGLGGFLALWSAADAVLWRPLPYAHAERLVRIWGAGNGERRNNANPLDAYDWRDRARSFDAVAIFNANFDTVTGAGPAAYLPVGRVSPGFFALLGARPALGRFFLPREETLGEHRVAVLSWETWQTRYAGDPGVLARTIELEGQPYRIVGVAARGFRHPVYDQLPAAALYRPLAIDREKVGRGGHWVVALGRLRAGVSLAAAQAEMDAIEKELGRENPANADWGAFVEPLHAAIAGRSAPAFRLLVAATGLLLLLACGNVAALLLARATSRGGELGVRVALGAGRSTLLRQLLLEVGLLGATAGVLACGVARLLLAGLQHLAAGQVPLLDRARLDWAALLVAAATTVVTVLAAGLAPSLHGIQVAMAARATGSRRRRGLERALVAAQLALCLTLLVGAALLARSLDRLYRVDPGFRPAHVVTFGFYLSGPQYHGEEVARTVFARLEQRLGRLPGVEAAGAVDILPLGGGYNCNSIYAEGSVPVADSEEPCAEQRVATPGYFAAVGLQRLAGRTFGGEDAATSTPVVVVTESFAQHHWPGRSPLGRRLKWGSAESDDPWRTVVGVVHDVRHFGLDAPIRPEVYMPQEQVADSGLEVVVRSAAEDRVLLPALRRAVAGIDPGLPLAHLRRMDELLADSTAARRLRTWALGGFAALALVLAVAGLYGSLAHAVGARRRELSVRMAVGAGRRQIVSLVLGEGAALTVAGLLAGGAGALVGARALRQLLFGVQPLDAASFAGAAALLAVVALAAAWLPARRAAAVDPVRALREE